MIHEVPQDAAEGQSLNRVLVSKAIEAIAREGVRNISMRSVSADAGGTTAAIVHHFGRKSGLIAAAIEAALAHEAAALERLKVDASAARLGHLNFVEWIAQHIQSRRDDVHARFWMELLFHARWVNDGAAAIRVWHEMRLRCWSEVLQAQGCDPGRAPFLLTYLCMEEVCAHGLGNFAEYAILQRETLRVVVALLYGRQWREECTVSDILEQRLDRFSLVPSAAPDAMQERLLRIAAQDIFEHGIGKLNQKRITDMAGVSSSMIAYHFGSMAAFRIQAIWRAMISPVANPLDPYSLTKSLRSLEDWACGMAAAVYPACAGSQSGFYVSFARMIGEVALLAPREPDLRPLVEHLRILDGTASFQAGRTIWKGVLELERSQASAFAMWMKGLAVFNELFETPRAEVEKMLIEVAEMFVELNKGAAKP